MYSRLQYISQGATGDEQLCHIKQALGAGCRWVQLRFKNANPGELLALAAEVRELCTETNATFIMNDHPEIAREIGADGVHLGLTDMPINEARRLVGDDKIIGGTANTLKQVLQRAEEGCDYIGLGPLRFTTTKEKLSPVLGYDGYEKIMNEFNQYIASQKISVSIPVYAIGGVVAGDIPALLKTGVFGIAVSGLITHHEDKKLLLQQLNTLLYEPINNSQ